MRGEGGKGPREWMEMERKEGEVGKSVQAAVIRWVRSEDLMYTI